MRSGCLPYCVCTQGSDCELMAEIRLNLRPLRTLKFVATHPTAPQPGGATTERPRNASEKILKTQLREPYWKDSTRRV
jgi:hypothetical protein